MDAEDLQHCRPEPSPPTAAQTAVPGGGVLQPDCLQCDCRGRGQGGWGRGLPDRAIRDVRDTETGDYHPGTLMVSQHTALDCFNAEMMIAAPLKMSLFIEYY